MAEYMAELRKFSKHCDFKDTLEDMLRMGLVWGIADSRIQHRLLAEDKLTFTKAQELAQAMELAAKDIKDAGWSYSADDTSQQGTRSRRSSQRLQ